MRPSTHPSRRRLLAPLVAVCLTLLISTAARADGPGLGGQWQQTPIATEDRDAAPSWHRGNLLGREALSAAWEDISLAQSQRLPTCRSVRFGDVSEAEVSLAYSDADLIGESDGSRPLHLL